MAKDPIFVCMASTISATKTVKGNKKFINNEK